MSDNDRPLSRLESKIVEHLGVLDRRLCNTLLDRLAVIARYCEEEVKQCDPYCCKLYLDQIHEMADVKQTQGGDQ